MARLARNLVVLGWLLAWVVATAAAATAIVDVDVEGWVARAGGGAVAVLHTTALAHRAGAGAWLWSGLVGIGTVAGLVSEQPWALSSVSVLAAVVSGVAAVLLTRAATNVWRGLVEYVVALAVAAAGALAVAGINAPVRVDRYALFVVGLALALAIAVVWQLGPDVHGSGRRGLAVVIGYAVVATGLLAYARLLQSYGSPAVVDRVDQTVAWLHENLHGVPRPVAALVGFPALMWGIGTRALRRQSWWLCAFGVVGTATVAVSLAPPGLDPELAARSAAYTAGPGALIGLLAWRLDLMLTRRRGRRGRTGRRAFRSDDDVRVIRPDPGRTRPLDASPG